MARFGDNRAERALHRDSGYSLAQERAPAPKPPGAEIIARPQTPSTADTVTEAGMRFLELTREDRPAAGSAPKPVTHDVAWILGRINTISSLLPALVESINNLPPPSSSRDEAVSQLVFPYAAASWIQRAPTGGPVKIAHDLYVKAHTDPESSKLKYEAPDWVRVSLRHLSIQQLGKDFPAPIEYVRQSKVVAPLLTGLEAKLGEASERHAHLANSNAKTAARGKDPLYGPQEAKAKSDMDAIRKEMDALVDKVTDVSPETIPAAANAVQIKVSPNSSLLNSMLRTTSQLERLIVLAVRGAAGKPVEATEFGAPAFSGNGKSEISISVNPTEIAALGRDSKALASAIDTLSNYREALRRIYPNLKYCEELVDNGPEIYRQSIGIPILRLGAKLRPTIISMIQHEDQEVRSATARLLTPGISLDAKGDRWGFLLQENENFDLLSAFTNRILRCTDADEREVLRQTFCSSPQVEQAVYPAIKQCLALMAKDDAGGLATFLDEQIVLQGRADNRLADRALLALLGEMAGNDEWSFALRHQIPHLEQIKQIGSRAAGEDEMLKKVMPELVHSIMRSLSQSLKDYYMDEMGAELEELIENFRYFLAHPECLEGIPGNEGIRTAVALYGKPGVGKTFLVNCLKNELNIELFSLSPADKEENQDRLDHTRAVIQKVKDHKAPCILLIDEAETTVVDRMSEHATSEDRDRTNYLLQEIDELRRLYPRVLIIIASNYPDRVDDALIRPGRVDLEFEMSPPSLKGRLAIIDGTLKREKLSLMMTPQQRQELAEISNGFIPVQIVQTIIETNRLYLPRMRERHEDFELTFDVMRSRFEGEARRLQRHNERLVRKGSPFATKEINQPQSN